MRHFLTYDFDTYFKQPNLTEVGKNDIVRFGKWLNGTHPEPLPEICPWDKGHAERILQRYEFCPYIVLDAEWIPESQSMYMLGIYAPHCSVTQWHRGNEGAASRKEVKEVLLTLIANSRTVFHNAKADIPVLEKTFGIPYTAYRCVEDTMYLHALNWCEHPHDLEFCASVYGKLPKLKHLSMSNPLYNAGDVVETAHLYDAMRQAFLKDGSDDAMGSLGFVYRNSMLPLIPITLERERLGLRVNSESAEVLKDTYMRDKVWASDLAMAYAGFPLNLGGSDRLSSYLSYTLKKNVKSIDEDTISKLRQGFLMFDADEEVSSAYVAERIERGAHPILEARALYARTTQYLSHYIEPFLQSSDGRIYPQFNIWTQNTGRWSTVAPPVAQLPRALRDLILPDPGWVWFEFDWDQIELRLIAAIARDEPLLEWFAKGYDPHLLNACDFFARPYPECPTKAAMRDACAFLKENPYPHKGMDPEPFKLAIQALNEAMQKTVLWVHNWGYQGSDDPYRLFAKPAVFRLCYGGKPEGAPSIPGAASLGIPSAQLVQASRRWVSKHPAIQRLWNRLEQKAVKERRLKTHFGRMWRFLSHDPARILRQAADFPMQGTVADLMNLTLIEIKRQLKERVRLAYTMHDSVKLQLSDDAHLETAIEVVKEIAQQSWEINGVMVHFPAEFHLKRYDRKGHLVHKE